MNHEQTTMTSQVIQLNPAYAPRASGPLIACAEDLAQTLACIQSFDREVFFVVTLTQKHRIIDRHLAFIGSLTEAVVHPREIFRHALYDSAASIAVVHNHPSGDPTPSDQDQALTKRLVRAGRLLGIPLLDHVILAREGTFSFLEEGLL